MGRGNALVLIDLALLGATAGACARVTPHRALPALTLGDPAFFPPFEAWTASRITSGNAVQLLFNGEQIFPAMLEAIASARKTITFAVYAAADGLVTRDFAEALAERCRAGVGVNVLLDMAGIYMPRRYVETMREAGCRSPAARAIP